MNLSAASQALFTDGAVGDSVLKDNHLPADVFPGERSWNQFHTLSDNDQLWLRSHSFGAPRHDKPKAKANFLNRPLEDVRNVFTHTNASAVRYSPDHRFWHKGDTYAVHQRLEAGCSFVVVSVVCDDGSVSKPLLLITGPTALPLVGATHATRTLFALEEAVSIPANVHVSMPEKLSPMTVCLHPGARDLVPGLTAVNAIETLRTQGRCLTMLSSEKLHSTVVVFDATDMLASRFDADEAALARGLKLRSSKDPGSVDVRLKDYQAGTISGEIPPDPVHVPSWDPSAGIIPSDDALDDTHVRATYNPAIDTTMVLLQPKGTAKAPNACFALLPRFLRGPLGALLPVGLVLDLEKLDPSTLPGFFADLTGTTDAQYFEWMSGVIFTTWIAAAKADPSAFCVTAAPHRWIVDLFSPVEPRDSVTSLLLHQEWSILAQLIWDHALSAATAGTRSQNTILKLQRYAEDLVSGYNDDTHPQALVKQWGQLGSIFNHGLLARLRPFKDDSLAAQNLLSILDSATPSTLPAYIRDCHVRAVKMPKTGLAFTVSPVLATDPDEPRTSKRKAPPPPPPGSPKTPTFNCAAASDTDDSASAADPPTKRSRSTRSRHVNFEPEPKTLPSATSSPEEEVTHVPPPLFHDPFPVKSLQLATAVSAVDAKWALPCHQRGQSSLPPLSPAGFSAALAICIDESNAANHSGKSIDQESENDPTFDFSRELMLANCPTGDTVSAYSFWLSYRMAFATDPAVLAVTTAQAYPTDYLLAPGRLQPKLASLFKAALTKQHGHVQRQALDNYFKEQVGPMNIPETARPDFEYSLSPLFFDDKVIKALLTAGFRSGYNIGTQDEPQATITPWTYLRSIPDLDKETSPRIPSSGLSPQQLCDLIGNIVYVFHLLSYNFRTTSLVTCGHSAFSRFSTLAGHLMLLAAKFKDRELQRAWDGPLSPKAFDITKAALVAIADLFSFYEQWMRPKFPPEQTFLAARVQRHCNLTLINPAVDGGNNRLDSLLTPWRQQINIFTLPNLSRVLPTDGFFLDKTPACYLPRDGGHRNNDRSEPSGRNNRRREQEGGSPDKVRKLDSPC